MLSGASGMGYIHLSTPRSRSTGLGDRGSSGDCLGKAIGGRVPIFSGAGQRPVEVNECCEFRKGPFCESQTGQKGGLARLMHLGVSIPRNQSLALESDQSDHAHATADDQLPIGIETNENVRWDGF
jgi:hypothetical protein